MDQYKPLFERQQIDGYSLLQLTDEVLDKSFRIKSVGHRINLITNLNHLKKLIYADAEKSSTFDATQYQVGNKSDISSSYIDYS